MVEAFNLAVRLRMCRGRSIVLNTVSFDHSLKFFRSELFAIVGENLNWLPVSQHDILQQLNGDGSRALFESPCDGSGRRIIDCCDDVSVPTSGKHKRLRTLWNSVEFRRSGFCGLGVLNSTEFHGVLSLLCSPDEFLVHWEGYSDVEDSWVKELVDIDPEMVKAYFESLDREKEKSMPSPKLRRGRSAGTVTS